MSADAKGPNARTAEEGEDWTEMMEASDAETQRAAQEPLDRKDAIQGDTQVPPQAPTEDEGFTVVNKKKKNNHKRSGRRTNPTLPVGANYSGTGGPQPKEDLLERGRRRYFTEEELHRERNAARDSYMTCMTENARLMREIHAAMTHNEAMFHVCREIFQERPGDYRTWPFTVNFWPSRTERRPFTETQWTKERKIITDAIDYLNIHMTDIIPTGSLHHWGITKGQGREGQVVCVNLVSYAMTQILLNAMGRGTDAYFKAQEDAGNVRAKEAESWTTKHYSISGYVPHFSFGADEFAHLLKQSNPALQRAGMAIKHWQRMEDERGLAKVKTSIRINETTYKHLLGSAEYDPVREKVALSWQSGPLNFNLSMYAKERTTSIKTYEKVANYTPEVFSHYPWLEERRQAFEALLRERLDFDPKGPPPVGMPQPSERDAPFQFRTAPRDLRRQALNGSSTQSSGDEEPRPGTPAPMVVLDEWPKVQDTGRGPLQDPAQQAGVGTPQVPPPEPTRPTTARAQEAGTHQVPAETPQAPTSIHTPIRDTYAQETHTTPIVVDPTPGPSPPCPPGAGMHGPKSPVDLTRDSSSGESIKEIATYPAARHVEGDPPGVLTLQNGQKLRVDQTTRATAGKRPAPSVSGKESVAKEPKTPRTRKNTGKGKTTKK